MAPCCHSVCLVLRCWLLIGPFVTCFWLVSSLLSFHPQFPFWFLSLRYSPVNSLSLLVPSAGFWVAPCCWLLVSSLGPSVAGFWLVSLLVDFDWLSAFSQTIDLAYFLLVMVVFLMAYGVAQQGILFPQHEASWEIITKVFFRPYFQIYGELFIEDAGQCLRGDGTEVPSTFLGPNLYETS